MKTCKRCRASMRNWAKEIGKARPNYIDFGATTPEETRRLIIRTAMHFRDGNCDWHYRIEGRKAA